MTATILILKVVATCLATGQVRWSNKGFRAEHPDGSPNSIMVAEIVILVIILAAIWV